MNLSAITSFANNFKHFGMKRRIEAAKFEPRPTFEKTIKEIKDNHIKSISSADMNLSDTT